MYEHPLDDRHDLAHAVGFGHEARIRRLAAEPARQGSRRDQDGNVRVHPSDQLRQVEAVESAGQGHVREHQADAVPALEQAGPVIGRGRLEHLEALAFERIHGHGTNQGIVLDDQDNAG